MDNAIRVIETNAKSIEEMLAVANGRSTAHAITRYGQIFAIVHDAEKRLNELLEKKDWPGARFDETSGEAVASSYMGSRNGTRVVLERRARDWFVVHVERVRLWRNGGNRPRLLLTTSQDEAARNRVAEKNCVVSA